MKGTATITFPDGTTYTRRTDRAYAFGIAYRIDENASAIEQAKRSIRRASIELARYEAVVASGVVPAADARYHSMEDFRRWVSACREEIAKSERVIATTPAEPKLTPWKVSQMSTRRDLAEKALASNGGSVYEYAGATVGLQILPVVFIPGKAK